MPVKIDRATRLEEELFLIATRADKHRRAALERNDHRYARLFAELWNMAMAAVPAAVPQSTTTFVKEFDVETVGDEDFRRELVLALATDWTLAVQIDAFADCVVRQADAIIARMKQ